MILYTWVVEYRGIQVFKVVGFHGASQPFGLSFDKSTIVYVRHNRGT